MNLLWKPLWPGHTVVLTLNFNHTFRVSKIIIILFQADVPRLVDDKHRERMKRFAEDNGFIAWYEVSAKTGEFVEEAIELLTHMVSVKSTEAPTLRCSTHSCRRTHTNKLY